MVKGIARRVVMIKSPDPEIFDEAIFIVREETAKKPGVTYDELMRQARDVAENFVRAQRDPHPRRRLPGWLCAMIGGGAIGLLWLMTAIL